MSGLLGVDRATDPDRQVAMVIDLNKCMGCQTCSVACKTSWTSGEGQEHMWWNKVNTMPGEGSPRGWEEMGGGFEARGRTVGRWRVAGGEMVPSEVPCDAAFGEYADLPHENLLEGAAGEYTSAPEERPDWLYNWDEDRGAGVYPNSYFFYLPRLCNHCSRPACLEACPRDAIYKRKEDGIVLIDEDSCHGYRFCMEACPYKVIYFDSERGTAALGGDEPGPAATADAGDVGGSRSDGSSGGAATDGGEAGVTSDAGGVSQKCIGCFPRIERGVAPACVRQCPGRARFYGFLDDEDEPVHRLVEEWGVALPLHPEYNTEPNVYYVPPLSSPRIDEDGRQRDAERIPRSYLRDLFGEAVDDALATLRAEREAVRRGEESELLDTLIGYEWPADFFPSFDRNPLDAKPPVEDPGSVWEVRDE